MRTFNLSGDEWDGTSDREGWRHKGALVGQRVGGELIGATIDTGKVLAKGVEDEDIVFARPGPTVEYWEGED